jgi:hypothetical protein
MRSFRFLVTLLAFTAALGLMGCGSSLGTQIPPSAGGLPPGAPAQAAVQPPFPNVYVVPPPRPTKLITEEEQARLEAELTAIRSKVNAQAGVSESERSPGDR